LDGFFSLFQRVTFLCLHKEQVTKRNAPQLPLVSCATRLAGRQSKTRPDKPHRTWLVAGLKQLIAETPANPALLGAADGDPEHHATATVSALNKEKRIWFLDRPHL